MLLLLPLYFLFFIDFITIIVIESAILLRIKHRYSYCIAIQVAKIRIIIKIIEEYYEKEFTDDLSRHSHAVVMRYSVTAGTDRLRPEVPGQNICSQSFIQIQS